VLIQVASQRDGSVVTYNNGTELLVYRGKLNTYAKRPGKPNVKEYVRALREFGIGTMLDPLAFLTGEPIQSAIGSASMKPAESIDGVKCDVVFGKLTPAVVGKAKSATVTYWIDKSTNLIRKVQIVTKGIPAVVRGQVQENGQAVMKSQPIVIDSIVIMNVQDPIVNPPLADSVFTFAVPKDAVEQPAAAPAPK